MFPLRDNVPCRRFPLVNYTIILANILVFFQELRLSQAGALESFLFAHALIPARFFSNPYLHVGDIFTSMFLHGSLMHVVGNMWFLYIFGDNVEDNMGHARYAAYYLLVGFGAAAAQLAASPGSAIPMVGASGAIAGVLGSYFMLYPGARVLTLFIIIIFVRIVEIPAFFFLGLWFLTQTFNGIGALTRAPIRGEMGGVAWWAHAGGFAAGFLATPIFRRR